LKSANGSAKRGEEAKDEIEASLAAALSLPSSKRLTSNLSKITQFTGYSDSVYAEAYVTVSQFDIEMDVLLVNQTKETIHNLTFELTTLGDLKLSQRPKPINIAPFGFQTLKTCLKVSSTENAVIFGNIAYDKNGVSDGCIVALNDIKIDVADYIQPATCSQDEFNKMYLKFEWENKIEIKGKAPSLTAWLSFILEKTHFNCITPVSNFDTASSYLSACLYARSIFGEDVVANLSLEFVPERKIVSGHLRLRAKATGIAYSLGEKICTFENVSLCE
jgi:coatomer subunit beta